MSHPVRVHLISLSLVLGLTVSLVWGQAPPSPVYLSLSGTNITTNNTEVLITDIGQDDHTSLTCHTDLTTCCRGSDGDAAGEWYYPDGSVVPNNAGTDDFARLKNAHQVIRLYRRIPPAATFPTGLYCCVIPTIVGEQTFCTNLVVCKFLTPPTNGTVTYNPPESPGGLGTIATYSCNQGYTVVGGISTGTCLAEGSWSGSEPTCELICPILTALANGTITYIPTIMGTLAFNHCDIGYSLNGLTIRTCSSNGVWIGEEPTCEAVVCGPPPSITNGSPGIPTKTIFDGTVTYSCNNGYILVGPVEISCLANGQWETLPICAPPPVYFSLSSSNYVTNNSEILLSSVGEDPGNYLTCHTDVTNCCRTSDTGVEGGVGAWHYPNGSVIPSFRDGGRDIYSNRDAAMVIRLNRRPGVAGPIGLYCCVIPTSTGTYVSCVNLVSVICPILTALANGTIAYIPTIMGTLAFYQCDVGYSLNGLAIRTCGSNAVWSGEEPICEAVVCGPPPSISNGSPGTSTTTLLGGTVTYTCNNGYILVGPVKISCLANGQWETPPMCAPPPVYFSLSFTNYVTNNSEILLSSVGEDPGNYLTCHTDDTNCCRTSDMGLESGVGVWHYPNGSVIPSVRDGGGDIYIKRDAAMVIRLNRRPGVASPTGLYCCVIPTSTGTDVSCVNLVSGSPSSQSDNTGAIVVVILGLALILAVTAIIIAYLVLKQRRMRAIDLKRPDIQLSDIGQSSPSQINETEGGIYEDIGKPCPPDEQFEYIDCQSHINTSASLREGMVNVEENGLSTKETGVVSYENTVYEN